MSLNGTKSGRFTIWMLYLLLTIILVHADGAWSQEPDLTLYWNEFEDNNLQPNVTIQTVGNFTSLPGIKQTEHFGSIYAFGFGKTDCMYDCWFNATTTLRIELPEPSFIALIAFDEAELGGNWGSSGFVKVDDQDVNDGLFERQPWNDLTADSTFRHREMHVNLIGRVIEITVIDITSASEMLIDNLAILTDDWSTYFWLGQDFHGDALAPKLSVQTTGLFIQQPGFRSPSQLGGSQAFGFGRSDCSISCLENNTTSLTWDLGADVLIGAIQFKEIEIDTNWGGQGCVYADDHMVPNSAFGHMPSNSGAIDSTFRLHRIPINQLCRRITLKVSDITRCGEIVLDDWYVEGYDSIGYPIRFENFESPALPVDMTLWETGNYSSPPGIKQTEVFGSSGAFGFGRSDCYSDCYYDNFTLLSLFIPEGQVEGIRFKAMELHSNFGSRGEVIINGQKWPGIDFSRQPLNDWQSDSHYRTFYLTPGYDVGRIDWLVWDITDASEVFIDDIELIRTTPEGVSTRDQQPAQFTLMQNFPNPFNAATTITYSLCEAAPVVMTIYNAQGQTVLRRDLGKNLAGEHKIEWNAESLSSGSYYCRLETPDVVKVIRLMLIR